MAAYVPALVWVISALVCVFIAKQRGVQPTLLRSISVVIFGPLAIPVIFFLKPDNDA